MKFLEAVARRWVRSDHPEKLIFRGSLVTGIWIGRHRRPCDDIDFLAAFPFDEAALFTMLKSALEIDCKDGVTFETDSLSSQPIFEDSDFPGARLLVNAEAGEETRTVQIDVGFNDPLAFPAIETALKTEKDTVSIFAPIPEIGFGWKLHGLVEKEGLVWRIKDLADLWLIAKHCVLDEEKLESAIRVAFESRDGPLWRLDRLINGEMGHSRGSRKQWDKIRESMPLAELPESIAEARDEVSKIAKPHWEKLRSLRPRFASDISLAEIEIALGTNANFENYAIPEIGTTFVYRHLSAKAFPEPEAAATKKEFRNRQLRLEARGITFDQDGVVIARPFPKFDSFSGSDPEALRGASAYEKLDGSLVFPTPTGKGFLMRTRRGPSEIADQAYAFLTKSAICYEEFVESCLQAGLTPTFEWCSRQHPIVLDYPEDKLVITSIRKNRCGTFLSRSEQLERANQLDIPIVECLGVIEDPNEWIKRIHNWTGREGCIVHTVAGEIVKIKSVQYRRLHAAIEGPHRDRARWQLILGGNGVALNKTSNLRGIDLEDYESRLLKAVEDCANRISAEILRFSSRKELAKAAGQYPAVERHLYFQLSRCEAPVELAHSILFSACEESLKKFHEVTALLKEAPLLNDG